MRALVACLLVALLPIAPSAGALCGEVEGVCVYDEERGDPRCEARDSEAARGTALYVDREDAHVGASGYEACRRGFQKDPQDPYTEGSERNVLVLAVVGDVAVSILWTEQTQSTDGVGSRACWIGAQTYHGQSQGPGRALDCPAPPPDAPWGRLLP